MISEMQRKTFTVSSTCLRYTHWREMFIAVSVQFSSVQYCTVTKDAILLCVTKLAGLTSI